MHATRPHENVTPKKKESMGLDFDPFNETFDQLLKKRDEKNPV